tara:strand:+ start:43 stop:864 length:822 start_codon:yes stop_codon:yes gene_type:complete
MSRQGKLAALASTGVTKAELDLLDGVTSTTAELNITDGVTSTAAELNILDGVTATAAEINLIDGGTARGTTAVADGDGFLTNDGGTMRMTSVDTLATYMGTKITGGSMVYLASSGVISDAASVVFTQFDATKYDHYQFWTQNIVPVTDNATFYGYTSTDGGSNYDTGGSDYVEIGTTTASANGFIVGGVGSASGETGITFAIGLHNPHAATKTLCTAFAGAFQASSGTVSDITAGQFGFYRNATADVDAIKFAFSSGNIESGEIVMYGIANGT